MKKIRDIYGFQVMDEIKKGTIVYGVDKAKENGDCLERIYNSVLVINEMAIKDALKFVEIETAIFWTIEKVSEEEVKEESVNG